MKRIKRNFRKCRIIDLSYVSEGLKTICRIEYYNPILDKRQVVKGVAKCNMKDDYDYTKGKHISESRAKLRLYQKYMESLASAYLDASDKYEFLIDREKDHINDLINS